MTLQTFFYLLRKYNQVAKLSTKLNGLELVSAQIPSLGVGYRFLFFAV